MIQKMNKNLLVLMMLSLAMFACQTEGKKMSLSGEWLSAEKGQMLYLAGNEWVDSVEVRNGKFEFNLDGKEPDEYVLSRINKGEREILLVYLDNCRTYLKLGEAEQVGNIAWIKCEIEGNPVGAVTWDAVFSAMKDLWGETTIRKFREVSMRGDLASAFILWKYASICVEFMTYDELTGYMNKLSEEVKLSPVGKRMFSDLGEVLTMAKGATAPDFTLNTPDGKSVSLSEYVKEKKVVLIDFWASWCAPCRAKNPEVLALYDKYHKDGFDVLGVSLDTDKDAWMRAIQEDKLPWTHVSELQGWDGNMRVLYNFNGLPNLVLVDGSRRILATSSELHRGLKEVLENLFK